MIQNRRFPAGEDWAALDECRRWLQGLGCSVGSMQRGSPIAVIFFDNCSVSKYRGLSHREIADTHGWITPIDGGRFRDGGAKFKVTEAGRAYLDHMEPIA